jgi:hypothetical protein
MAKKFIISALVGLCTVLPVAADDAPFIISSNLFDAANTNTLGLSVAPGTQTFTVFAPSANTDHFSNGVVMIAFKGALYCMWQSSKTSEDTEDTWVAYSRSTDGGLTWAEPMVLAATISNGYCSSGGWYANADSLIGYINTWPADLSPEGGYTRYVASADGLTWTQPADVKMADGTSLTGIFEQDPHVLPDGRIVNAAHFQPGLKICPIYTDDASGVRGWKRGSFAYTPNGTQSREMEPSLYRKADGTLVMIFRDQNSTFYKLAASSSDRGETWTKAVVTNMPDSRSKQSAGNLPDGTAFFASNPVTNKNRKPLAITLSSDGNTFTQAWLLRSATAATSATDSLGLQAQRYSGTSKGKGFIYPKSMVSGDYLYVAYSTNKEDVQYSRIPLNSISMNTSAVEGITRNDVSIYLTSDRKLAVNTSDNSIMTIDVYGMQGTRVLAFTADGTHVMHDVSALSKGLYIVRVKTALGSVYQKIYLK